MIAHVWEGLNTREHIDPLGDYPHQFDTLDSLAYSAYYMAKGFLKDRTPVGKTWLQALRDALYMLHSTAWKSVRSTGVLFRQIVDTLDDDLPIDPETVEQLEGMTFQQQLAFYEKFHHVKEIMIERLGKAEDLMVRCGSRPGSEGQAQDTQGHPDRPQNRQGHTPQVMHTDAP